MKQNIAKPKAMENKKLIKALSQKSLYEIFRIKEALEQELKDSTRRDYDVKINLFEGQKIYYFDPEENKLKKALIEELKRSTVTIKDQEDGKRYIIRYYMIDLDNKGKDYDRIVLGYPNKNAYQVGDAILFVRNGKNIVGMITQLKNDVAIVKAINETYWKVPYTNFVAYKGNLDFSV